jgi:hypothetical protein
VLLSSIVVLRLCVIEQYYGAKIVLLSNIVVLRLCVIEQYCGAKIVCY